MLQIYLSVYLLLLALLAVFLESLEVDFEPFGSSRSWFAFAFFLIVFR
jgi:hypothetical protein